MNVQEINLSDTLIIIGSIIGSIKTVITINNGNFCSKWLDIFLGIFVGIVTGYHFSTEYNLYLTGLISLVAGASGAILLKTIIEILPTTFKSYIEKKVNK